LGTQKERELERPRNRWKDNIKIILKEIGWECVVQINLFEDREQWQVVINMAMSYPVP
jgi:hypothetical protein